MMLLLVSNALRTLHSLLTHKLSISPLALRLATGWCSASPSSSPPRTTATCRSPSTATPRSPPSSADHRFVRTVFDMLDADMDGRLSTHDVAHHLAKLGMADPSMAEAPESSDVMPGGIALLARVPQSAADAPLVIDSMDYEDFVRWYEDGDEELAEAFAMYDVDGDGFISCEELQEALVRMGFPECRDKNFCHLMVQSVDANSDGKIDYFEFRQMMSPKI